MAIAFVGSKTFTHAAITAQSCSLTDLLDTAGSSATLLQNDIVFVVYVHSMATTATRTLAQCTPSGYANAHASIVQANDSNAVSLAVSYKVMGATPDTTVSIPAAAATTNGVACTIHAFRGMDTSGPMDATAQTATGTNGGIANPPSITPVSRGAWVMACGGAAVAAGAVFTNSGDLSATTNHFRSVTITSTTNDANAGAGIKTDWSAGAFDPAAFGGSTSTNTGSWGAVTLALKPLTATATATPTLDAATASATGVLPIAGASTPTLGATTLSSAGLVLVKADSGPTLGAATLSAEGVLTATSVTADFAQTLDAVTASSAATLPLAGSVSATLSAATLSSAATLTAPPVLGTATPVLGGVTVASVTTLLTHGALAAAVGAIALEAHGSPSLVGGASLTLGAVALSGTGAWIRLQPVTDPAAGIGSVPAPPGASIGAVPSPGIQIVTVPTPPVATIH